MAKALDRMLDSNERVIYRDPMAPWSPVVAAIVFAIMGVALAWISILRTQSSGAQPLEISALAFAATGSLAVAFWMAICIARNALLVTDRRVVHRSGWCKETVTSMPLSEIRALIRRPGIGLEIQGRDGETIVPCYCKRPDKLAQAIAHRTSLAPPNWPGAKERLVQALIDYIHPLAMGVSFFLLVGSAAVLLLGFKSIGWSFLDVPALLLFLGGLTASVIAYSAICLLGWMFVIAAARSFMNAEEMRTLLCRDADDSRANQMLVSLFLRFASLLYGQPIRCESFADDA